MNYLVRNRKIPWLKLSVAVILAVLAVLVGLHMAWGKIIYLNTTSSAPRGIYLAVPGELSYGDYAIVRCPQAIPTIHIPEGYLMLKKAAAFPGDTYEIKNSKLAANGKIYTIYHLDYLPQLQVGKQSVPEGTILFLNDPPDSLDSRYFGPISIQRVETKVIFLFPYDIFSPFFS